MNELRLEDGKWACASCGCDYFTETVVAQNYVALHTDDGVLVESHEFQGSWEVTERLAVRCANCLQEVSVPEHARVQ